MENQKKGFSVEKVLELYKTSVEGYCGTEEAKDYVWMKLQPRDFCPSLCLAKNPTSEKVSLVVVGLVYGWENYGIPEEIPKYAKDLKRTVTVGASFGGRTVDWEGMWAFFKGLAQLESAPSIGPVEPDERGALSFHEKPYQKLAWKPKVEVINGNDEAVTEGHGVIWTA